MLSMTPIRSPFRAREILTHSPLRATSAPVRTRSIFNTTPQSGPELPPSNFLVYGIDLNGQHYNAQAAVSISPGNSSDPSAISPPNSGHVIFQNVAEGTTISGETLNGGGGIDFLYGSPVNDIINGGAGNDTLFGGAGRDTFVVIAGSGNDTLHFQSGAGGDVVDLVGYGYTSFADVMAHMAQTSSGAQLVNSNGETISFLADNSIPGGNAVPPTPGTFTSGNFVLSGATSSTSDQLTVHVSEDAFQGNAEFAVLVDGKQIGVVQSTTALHSQGQVQDIALVGHFGTDPHTVQVQFLNDTYAGTPTTDRNLYVEGITYNGHTYSGEGVPNTGAGADTDPNAAEVFSNGTVTFSNVVGASSSPPPPPPSTSTLVVHVSEDAFQGDAQFNVRVDGAAQITTFTATASHAAGQTQDITITGDFGTQGPNTIDIQFLNDAYGGTASTDRNLYIPSLDINGVHFDGNTAANNAANGHAGDDLTAAVMDINGTATFNIAHTAPPELMG